MSDLIRVDDDRLRELVREIAREEIERSTSTKSTPGRLLTPAEVAQLWGCSTRTVTRQLLDGLLPGVRVGRNWRIKPEDAAR